MKTRKQRIVNVIQAYENAGWTINDHRDELHVDYEFSLYSPTGTVFRSDYLIHNNCPFCEEEDEPEGDGQFTCEHEPELMDEEREAKNLLNFILIREKHTILMCDIL